MNTCAFCGESKELTTRERLIVRYGLRPPQVEEVYKIVCKNCFNIKYAEIKKISDLGEVKNE